MCIAVDCVLSYCCMVWYGVVWCGIVRSNVNDASVCHALGTARVSEEPRDQPRSLDAVQGLTGVVVARSARVHVLPKNWEN